MELGKVLLVAQDDSVVVGSPFVARAKVLAEVLGEAKDDKILVFKYKNKVRYRRKIGHRQIHTSLAIKQVVTR